MVSRAKNLFVAVAACVFAAGCSGAVDPQSEPEQTASSSAAQKTCADCTSFTGKVKGVDFLSGAITIENHGAMVTLLHTASTVHVEVVPGPMHIKPGVVPGPMHWLWLIWNEAIKNGLQASEFVWILDELAYEAGFVKVTTTDGTTIASVQPVP
jgi:hypothetical protein